MIHSCNDPATIIPAAVNNQPLLVLGHDLNGNGVGNAILFYLPIYYFAAMFRFRIIIDDETSLGTYCKILRCRYPLLSSVQQSVAQKPSMFISTNMKNFSSDIVYKTAFASWGFDGFRDLPTTLDLKCAVHLSGCKDEQLFKNLSLQSCFQHHAMQRLIEGGPFESEIISRVSKRLMGSTENHTRALLSLPHTLAPRFHVGIHVRAQFRSFEIQQVPTFAEVNSFLSSTRYGKIYRVLRDFVNRHITSSGTPSNNHNPNHHNDSIPYPRDSQLYFDNHQYPKKILVYLSADDERVKAHIINQLTEDPLLAKSILMIALRPIGGVKHSVGMRRSSRTESFPDLFLTHWLQSGQNELPGIHVTHQHQTKSDSSIPNDLPDSALDMAFDWYLLSLCNNILIWRNSMDAASTFSYTASILSRRKNITSIDVRNQSTSSTTASSEGQMHNASNRPSSTFSMTSTYYTLRNNDTILNDNTTRIPQLYLVT